MMGKAESGCRAGKVCTPEKACRFGKVCTPVLVCKTEAVRKMMVESVGRDSGYLNKALFV